MSGWKSAEVGRERCRGKHFTPCEKLSVSSIKSFQCDTLYGLSSYLVASLFRSFLGTSIQFAFICFRVSSVLSRMSGAVTVQGARRQNPNDFLKQVKTLRSKVLCSKTSENADHRAASGCEAELRSGLQRGKLNVVLVQNHPTCKIYLRSKGSGKWFPACYAINDYPAHRCWPALMAT